MRKPKSRVKTELQSRSRRRRKVLTDELAARRSTAPRRNDLVPDLRLEQRPLTSLEAPGRSIRKLGRPQVEAAKRAIASLGQCVPLVINDAGEIVDGVVRWQAARELGLVAIWCVIVDHLTPEELRLLRLQLNRLQEQGEWDFDALRVEFAELLELDLPLEVTGFTLPEVDQIVLDEVEDDAEADEFGDDDAEAVCRRGDIWALGAHRIACGDCRDAELLSRLFEAGDVVAAVLTDPPYNVPIAGHVTSGDHAEFAMASGEMSRAEFADFNSQWMAAALPFLRDGGLIMPFIDWRSIGLMIAVGEVLDLTLLNLVVWAKSNAGMGSLWRSQHELLPILKKGQAPHVNNVALGKEGRWRSNLWTYPGASTLGSDAREGLADHPTVKPVAMLVDALLDITHRGDLVLDPFLGSGSTLIAAERTGRKCRAVEIDPAYVDVAIRRWIRETGKDPELVGQASATREAPMPLLPAPAQEAEPAQ